MPDVLCQSPPRVLRLRVFTLGAGDRLILKKRAKFEKGVLRESSFQSYQVKVKNSSIFGVNKSIDFLVQEKMPTITEVRRYFQF